MLRVACYLRPLVYSDIDTQILKLQTDKVYNSPLSIACA